MYGESINRVERFTRKAVQEAEKNFMNKSIYLFKGNSIIYKNLISLIT
jgi:hypothetical protein